MNFSNIWTHPKTSIAGLLIGAATIAGVLSQQGITLGNAGTGTVVALIGAICTALLGLLARDPSADPQQAGKSANSQAKLGAWMLISLLMLGTMPVIAISGCTQAQRITVAQEIVNWTPVFISTADTVNATVEQLDPASVLILGPITLAVNAFGPQLQIAAQAYLNNPNQTTLQVLQSLVVQIQQSTSAALLAAAKITNPASQALATKNINLIATVINTILALVQSISTKAQVAAMAAQVHITLAQVRPYMDEPALQRASDRVAFDLALNQRPTANQFFATEARSGF